ncbi:MAG: hypothetical protein ACFE9D_06825 [Promethearchaeota archaeon]
MLLIGVVAALIAAFSWAVSAAFYKTGAKDISPLTANLIRVLLPLLILVTMFLTLNLFPQIFLLTPLFAALIGWRSLEEHVDLKTLIAIIACVIGIILITITEGLA